MSSSEEELVVEIARSVLYTILWSIIEVWPNEPVGKLTGKRFKNRFIIINAFAHQIAKRKPDEVYYENGVAWQKIVEVSRAINPRRGLGFSFIGDYHGHAFQPGQTRVSYLGRGSDLESAFEEMEVLKRSEFIAIVTSTRIGRYKNKPKPGENISERGKCLRAIWKVIAKDGTYRFYDVIFSAYLISRKKGRVRVQRIKIKVRRGRFQAAP